MTKTVKQENDRIIELLILGKTEKEIAADLGLTRRSVVYRIDQMKRESLSANITELACKELYKNVKKFAHLFQTASPRLG